MAYAVDSAQQTSIIADIDNCFIAICDNIGAESQIGFPSNINIGNTISPDSDISSSAEGDQLILQLNSCFLAVCANVGDQSQIGQAINNM